MMTVFSVHIDIGHFRCFMIRSPKQKMMSQYNYFKLTLLWFLAFHAKAQQPVVPIVNLIDTVEIITDVWGIPHIYADNEYDLFFAQGFYAARDRLFQFELWRRQATGTVAEILGRRELERDIGTRLFKFRGDMDREMNYYHDRGKLIISAYVDGVNAYIDLARRDPENLPVEFNLLGILPEKWTPEIVISRHQGLLGNIGTELDMARAVSLLGQEKVKELVWFHPKDPDLVLDEQINQDHLFEDILGLYNAFRRPVRFLPGDIVPQHRNSEENYGLRLDELRSEDDLISADALADMGSNNWVISGSLTESGYPIMANDPHRRHSAPSLRYMAHLVGPGWNVIGGGEPVIPGISIGHNEFGAWGLTVFNTDAEDLYVYRLNPEDPDQYAYKNNWEDMRIITDTISVKGEEPHIVALRYTRHGPVVFHDADLNVAYAIRCGWLEIGGSPYLASLRMDQAHDFESFRAACNYSHIPGENMVWADRNGNIGWQAVGIAPVRRHWSGLVPVPGDGSHEWDGYLPIIAKPSLYNPQSAIINTSNEHVTPLDYELWDAIGFNWSDPYRGDRVMEVLSSGTRHSIADMTHLQTDHISIPARQLVPLLLHSSFRDSTTQEAAGKLAGWDYDMKASSVEAGIYNAFERRIRSEMKDFMVPEKAHPFIDIQMKKIVQWLVLPDGKFGTDPVQGRNQFLKKTFELAVQDLAERLGPQIEDWVYGQEDYKHVWIRHPLGYAVNETMASKLNVGPYPRGGNSYTVNNTSSADNQVSGGSFRMIVDLVEWDQCLATNAPGQHGNPDHPHYDNLFEIWASDQFFPLLYSRDKIEAVQYERLILAPVTTPGRD